MKNTTELTMSNRTTFGDIVSYFFGALFMAIGLINTFWGNDPGYGIFIMLLSFVFIPPATAFFKKISGISIPLIVKIFLGAFIIWSALGVGELFDKIEMMKQSF